MTISVCLPVCLSPSRPEFSSYKNTCPQR